MSDTPYKVYGVQDPDTTAYDLLMQIIKDKKVARVLLHQRMPINARPCKLPGSLTVQAVLESGEVITVRQPRLTGPAKRIRNA